MNMKRYWKTKSVFTISLLAASQAVGASFSYEYFIPSEQEFNSTDWTDSFYVAQFNSSWGQLVSVDITFGGVVQVSYFIENKGSIEATFEWNQNCDMTLTLPDFSSIEIQTTDSGSKTIGAGQSESWSSGPFSDSGSKSFSGDSVSPFVGSGFVQMPVSAEGDWSLTGGSYAAAVTTEARASVVVTYNYVPVPESSLVGLVSGFGLLGFIGCRRAQRARKLAR